MKIYTGNLLAFVAFLTLKCADAVRSNVVGNANQGIEYQGAAVRCQLGNDIYVGRLVTVVRQNQLTWQRQNQLDQPHILIIAASGMMYTAALNKHDPLPAHLMPQPARQVTLTLNNNAEPYAYLYNAQSEHQAGAGGSDVIVKLETGQELGGTLSAH